MDTSVRIRRRWRILAALGATHLAVLFVGPLLVDEAGLIPLHDARIPGLAGGLLAGGVLAHWLLGVVAAVGIWVALGSGRWYVRLPIGVLLWLWLVMSFVLGELLTPNWPYGMSALPLLAAVSAAISVLACAVGRRFLGLHFTLDGEPLTETTGRRFQFRLVHLAAAVTLIAVTLALGRLLNQRSVHLSVSYLLGPRFVLDWLTRLAVEAWCPAAIAGATVMLTLDRRERFLWVAVLLVLLIPLDALVQFGAFVYRNRAWVPSTSYGKMSWGLLQERLAWDGALALSLFLSVAVLRSLGYRLEFAQHETGATAPRHAA